MEGNGTFATQSQQTGQPTQQTGQPTQQAGQQQQRSKCSGNCLNCLPAQRGYCASQHAYSNMRVLDKMMEAIIHLEEEVKGIAEKIEAIQNNEALLFDPKEAVGEAAGTTMISPLENQQAPQL